MIKTLNTLFVTMLGLGKVPKIPGTFGSLATAIILYIFFHILNIPSKKLPSYSTIRRVMMELFESEIQLIFD